MSEFSTEDPDYERRGRPLPALLFSLGLVCAAAAVAAYADAPLPALSAFVPVIGTATVIASALTAFLLSIRFRATRDPAYAALCAAYAFSALIVLAKTLDYPGVLTATGLVGMGERGALWAWLTWHAGYSFLVALAVLHRCGQSAAPQWLRTPSPIALGTMLSLVAIASVAWASGSTAPSGGVDILSIHPAGIAVVSLEVSVLASLVILTRCRTVLEQWLAVALLAGVVELVLGLLGAGRFTAGWYFGRILGGVTAAVVLGVLVCEFGALYRRVQEANRRLLRLATADPLTGLANRRYLDEQLASDVRRCRTDALPLALVLIDVDRFKQYNDRYGHAAGDVCLVRVAEELQRQVRAGAGFLARYGGEEFVAVFPGLTETQARQRAEALRAGVASLAIPTRDGIDGIVTVSAGLFASAPDARVDSDGYLVRADQALYQAKRDGRNRVCSWNQAAQDALRLAVA